MKITTLGLMAILATATYAQAETIRYTYDTEASYTRVGFYSPEIISGPTNTFAGKYNGTTGHVTGTIDIDNSSGSDVVTGFSLDTVLPFGLPQGHIDTFNTDNFAVDSAVSMSFGDGTSVYDVGYGFQFVKDYLFDTRFGAPYYLFSNTYPSPSYDRNDDTLYPFRMTLTMQRESDGTYSATSLQSTCEERDSRGQLNTSSCNGFYWGDRATWDSGAGRASFSEVIPAAPAVPLPAGGVLLLSGLAALGLRKRLRAA